MSIARKRTPDGVDFKKPIALRLMPKEREQAELLSKRLGKTKAAFAREAYLAGIPLIIASSNTAVATAVRSSGVESIIGTAAFSSQSTGQS